MIYRKSFPLLLILLLGFPLQLFPQFYVETEEDELEEETNFELYTPTRYNRVEGLFIGIGAIFKPTIRSQLEFTGHIGYGLSSGRVRYFIQVEKGLPELQRLRWGLSYFDATHYNERWIISELENTFAALLFREDFLDYFRLKGWNTFLVGRLSESVSFKFLYQSAHYYPMDKRTDWSVLGGHKKFRDNPSVAEGLENKIQLSFTFDGLDNRLYPMKGWFLQGVLERCGGNLKGDFFGNGLFLTVHRFQQIFQNQRLHLKIRIGSRQNSLIPQHLMDFGGIGTLRAYRYKEFRDVNRLVLIQLAYYMNDYLLQKLPLQWIPFYDSLSLILFWEGGNGWLEPPPRDLYRGFNWQRLRSLKSNLGISLSVSGDLLRIDFARRLDRSKDVWAVTFRVLPRW